MKLESKYFDKIRIGSRSAEPVRPQVHACQWKGCAHAGTHKAPMGRGSEGRFYLFCLDHVRQYNANYNYFQGMTDAAVEEFQKDALTGHRPTWKVGANAWAHGTRTGAHSADPAGAVADAGGRRINDPHSFFAWRAKRAAPEEMQPQRYLKPLERKSLDALHLPEAASKGEIKARFKELVKRHHPDANGGDRRSEDKLREIIQAYNYLKQAGLV
jgi:curved DNA-binding protein CbpA